MIDGSVRGFVRDDFSAVRSVFEENLSTGQDVGASYCVTVEGETLVDLWGGFAGEDRTRSWDRDTIVGVYSTTKTVTALTALLLADHGALDLDAPIARYWPEFAVNGKEFITVAQVLSHSSGLSGWAVPITAEDLLDWEKATGLLAAQATFWQPGSASGYHAITYGYLVGEVVRRVTGQSLGTVFHEQFASPLGVDFHIGLPASEDSRVANLIPPVDGPPTLGDETSLQVNAATNPLLDVDITRRRDWRGAEIPAIGGIGNARSLARAHTVLATGGFVGDKRIMSEAGCRKALEPQIDGRDLILDIPVQFGLGFAVGGGMPNPNTLYWGGYGGSLVVIDLDAHSVLAYTMNRMTGTTIGDERAFGLAFATWEAMLDRP
jgi:CubicO group peptidase (beta-lactamase class C family)